ncbi:hypothetical protein KKE85_01525, partial [Patescibacteria group bacterium]|nr:hypothetical protein [Patescibacteria group bacterium]
MKKNCLLFIMLIICGLFLGLSQQVCAANPPGFAVAFISEIGPTNIQTGDTVNGTLIIEASCYSGAVGGAVFFKPIINFGEAPPPSATAPDEQLEGGPCVCVNDSNDTSLKTVRCSYNFSHTYSRTGTFAVIPKTSYSSFGSSAV